MVNKRSKKVVVGFNSPELEAQMLAKAYVTQPRWFENVSSDVLADFALKYATKLWNVAGNGNPTSVVVSYPHQDGLVRMVDLDSGEKFWVKLSKLTKSRISGRAQEFHYELGYVRDSGFECEVEDICYGIEWDSIKRFDKGEKDTLSKVEAKLVAIPRKK